MTCSNANGQNLLREGHVQPRQNTNQASALRCNSKIAYAPPVSKDAADRVQHPCRCVYGQTLRIKLHIKKIYSSSKARAQHCLQWGRPISSSTMSVLKYLSDSLRPHNNLSSPLATRKQSLKTRIYDMHQ